MAKSAEEIASELDAEFEAEMAASGEKDSSQDAVAAVQDQQATTEPVQDQQPAAQRTQDNDAAVAAAAAQRAAQQQQPAGQQQADQQQQATQPDPNSLFARLAQAGLPNLDQKYKTEDELIRGFVNLQQAFGRRNDEAEIGRRIIQGLASDPNATLKQLARDAGIEVEEVESAVQAAQQQAAQQQGAQHQVQAGQSQPAAVNIPEWDNEWPRQFTLDGDGKWVMSADANPADLQKYIRAVRWQREALTDPNKMLNPLIEQRAGQLIEPIRQQLAQQQEAFRQFQEQQAAAQQQAVFHARQQQVLQATSGWAMTVDPLTNQQVYTPAGRMLHAYASQLMNRGMDPLTAAETALGFMAQAGQIPGQQQAAAHAAVQPVNGQPGNGQVRRNVGPATAPAATAQRKAEQVSDELRSIADLDRSFNAAMTEALKLDGVG